jgi:hypothetical protein
VLGRCGQKDRGALLHCIALYSISAWSYHTWHQNINLATSGRSGGFQHQNCSSQNAPAARKHPVFRLLPRLPRQRLWFNRAFCHPTALLGSVPGLGERLAGLLAFQLSEIDEPSPPPPTRLGRYTTVPRFQDSKLQMYLLIMHLIS